MSIMRPWRWLGARPAWVAVAVGLAWRLVLSARYAGWEESDYGNLAMVRGVFDGGFRHFDMSHMPGYYALAAVGLFFTDDTVLAARVTTMVGGLVALGLAVGLVHRAAGPWVAWLAALLLVFQPEFALYSASSLREPVYAAFVMVCLAGLLSDRLLLAGVFAGAAFLVRFDGALALTPVLLLVGLERPGRSGRLVRVLSPLVVTIALWSTYTWLDHGTWRFWSHAVSVNLDTGLGAEAAGSAAAWWSRGIELALGLVAWVLPSRIGWAPWAAAGAFGIGIPWSRRGPARTWLVLAVGLVGVWAGMGLVAQHDLVHNLYWKWMCPLVPVVVPLGAWGLVRSATWMRARAGTGAMLGILVVAVSQALWAELHETRRQLDLSADLYRPQLQLARWFEASVPEDVPVVVDNIPACWLNRRPNQRHMVSWFDIPTRPGDEDDFARWIREEGIQWVLWFRENWTQAPVVAPFLADGGTWKRGGVSLRETRREDDYGWILYEVDLQGEPVSSPDSPHLLDPHSPTE